MSDLDQRQPLQTTRPLRKVRQLQASASGANANADPKPRTIRREMEKSFFIVEKFFFVVPWAYVNKRSGTRA